MTTKMKRLLAVLLLAFAGLAARAQGASVSTNAIDYANFGTVNVEASYAIAQHWCMTAGLRYNPFTWKADTEAGVMQNRQQSYAVGVRYWPWHVYSGWWLSAKGQYQEYNAGGIAEPLTREGDRFGAGIGAGYSYMLGRHFNLEAGVGAWAGHDSHVTYSCPECGRVVDRGNGFFALLNEILLSLSYVF